MSRMLKADEQFARLLEVHSTAVAAEDPALGALANIANALRVIGATSAVTPDPAFRAALRQRLVAVATVQVADAALTRTPQRSGATAALSWRVQKRIAALASVATLGTSLAGVGVAAARSLPGDPFYGVKRATEHVQLWAARGDTAKGHKHLAFARTRLSEAEQLDPNSSHFASTLAAMDSETEAGSSELISAYQSGNSTQPLADLMTFTSQQISDLNDLAASLPPAAKAQEVKSVTLLTGVVKHVHKVANGVCILCGQSNVPLPTTTKTPGPTNSGNPSPTNPSKPGTKTSGPGTGGHPSSHPSSSAPTGTKTSKHPIQLPTDLPITPTSIVSSILHPKKTPLPVVTKLLGGLLGGKTNK